MLALRNCNYENKCTRHEMNLNKKSKSGHTIFLLSVLTVTAFALPITANSKTVTAVCGPLTGYTVGVSGSSDRFKPLSYPDTMDGPFTFKWDTNERTAVITGSGSAPTQEQAVVVKGSPEQISAVVVYPIAVFVYSIFLERKLMLISKHTHSRGTDYDAARGFIMRGDCSSVVIK
jgi:hypothetical protein